MNNSQIEKELLRSWWKKAVLNNPTGDFGEKRLCTSENKVFSIPLTESIHYAYAKIIYRELNQSFVGVVPLIIATCGRFLKEEAIYTEGVFRISGNSKRVLSLQSLFDHAPYGLHLDWSNYTVHDASTIMRRFLNQLPEPIINLQYQLFFKRVLEDDQLPTEANKIEAFQNMIQKIPIVHQFTLYYLLELLHLFSFYSQYTKMDISSLATAFTPCFFTNLTESQLDITEYNKCKNVVAFLIEHQAKFKLPQYNANTLIKLINEPSERKLEVNTERRHSTTAETNSLPNPVLLKRSKTVPNHVQPKITPTA